MAEQQYVKIKFDAEYFANSVTYARKSQSLSLRDVSEITGISPSTLSRIENGHNLDVETFGQLCEWMRIEPREFFYAESEQPK